MTDSVAVPSAWAPVAFLRKSRTRQTPAHPTSPWARQQPRAARRRRRVACSERELRRRAGQVMELRPAQHPSWALPQAPPQRANAGIGSPADCARTRVCTPRWSALGLAVAPCRDALRWQAQAPVAPARRSARSPASPASPERARCSSSQTSWLSSRNFESCVAPGRLQLTCPPAAPASRPPCRAGPSGSRHRLPCPTGTAP